MAIKAGFSSMFVLRKLRNYMKLTCIVIEWQFSNKFILCILKKTKANRSRINLGNFEFGHYE